MELADDDLTEIERLNEVIRALDAYIDELHEELLSMSASLRILRKDEILNHG